MRERLREGRVLIYSHDTFGLGHLRRCRAIAHALVEKYKGLSVLILSGSPIIGSFDFRARVDFVRIPGVIKLHNGEYTSLGLHIDLEQTLAIRASIIQHTAEIYAPDLFLVDKEPLGFRGEVVKTLEQLKERGTVNILGLRDVMDEPTLLRREWQRKQAIPALCDLYDEIWVFGLEKLGNPLSGLDVPEQVLRKMIYTGYLRRPAPNADTMSSLDMKEPFILVTAGGGGDGIEMVDWVLRAYENDQSLRYPLLMVLGPFMPASQQRAVRRRAKQLAHVQTLDFDSHIECIMQRAEGVIAMGGYNTFCEILSLNKRALLVPRSCPRKEQLIRAQRAQALGLARMLNTADSGDWRVMANALHALPLQPLPSQVLMPRMLGGLGQINERVGAWMTGSPRAVVELTAAPLGGKP